MKAEEIRKAYLEFFSSRAHTVIPRARLVPDNDPTTLFTGSGMQPLLPYLLGETHPDGIRLTDSQTCLRAQDVDEVGDNRHTVFFEMLGNWSLGDYFKAEQLPWFFEFLTKVAGLDPSKLYVTVFDGAPEIGVPRDEGSIKIWQKIFADAGLSNEFVPVGSEENGYKIGMPKGGRIFSYDGSKNWWSRSGEPSAMPEGEPGGPDSEVFYDFGLPHDPKYGENCHPNCDCGRFMEIGNSVFMEYIKRGDKFEPLPQKNVDFGGGLERIAAAAINSPDVFKISLFQPIIAKLEELSGKDYDSNAVAMRVIADHLRAATFLAVDQVQPSNREQGYVMRRLIRRAVRFAFDLGIEQNFLDQVVPTLTKVYIDDYPELKANEVSVIDTLIKEERAFRQTLRNGLKMVQKLAIDNYKKMAKNVSMVAGGKDAEERELNERRKSAGEQFDFGEILFTLYDTYGFPVELSVEEIWKNGIELPDNWRESFDAKMAKQREMSKTAAKGTFKGGLGGHTWEHRRYHTATHLLQSALRTVFGDQLRQHGSNITEERLRFDFNLDHKMTDEEKQEVEDLVNGWINEDLPVKFTLYPTQNALDMGAIGPFGERYGDEVKVYQMGPDDHIVSLEICGGPHCERTGQLATTGELNDGKDAPNKENHTDPIPRDQMTRRFKIAKEEASSAGIRRIKAVLA